MKKMNEMNKAELINFIDKYSKELEQIKELKTRTLKDLNREAKLGQQIYEATQWLEGIKEREKVKNMKNYRTKKEALRIKAMEYQRSEENYSWAELAELCDYFTTEGKKLGLLREFRTEGII